MQSILWMTPHRITLRFGKLLIPRVTYYVIPFI